MLVGRVLHFSPFLISHTIHFHVLYKKQVAEALTFQDSLRGDVKMQVAATATVCSRLQKVAILLVQFRLI